MKTIAVLTAMTEELNAVLTLFNNAQESKCCGIPVHIAEFNGKRFLLALSGVGRTNTAINAALIAQEYKPDAMLNIGSAGGLKTEQKILDVVIPKEIVGVDIDLTALGFEYGAVMNEPASYFVDENLHQVILKLSRECTDISIHEGTVGSSEAFICKPEQVAEIGLRFKGRVVCVEMEAFSVAVVCNRFKIPFAIIRSLSDVPAHGSGNELAFNEFLHSASRNAAKILYAYASL
ncbi:5'-methylthioadenosine/S-adenosylhomocysteine nucleosidase [Fibrobacterales bacterium]|nr:5'-methylthioadenosine/S-adenosylhomocysteine nucleosidase [Fibrobacterales bacterium]